MLISLESIARDRIAGPSKGVLHFIRNFQLSEEVVLMCLFLITLSVHRSAHHAY